MPAPAPVPDSQDRLSYSQACQLLACESVRSAYLVDAVHTAVHRVNEAQQRSYASMLRALFHAVAEDRATFTLYEGRAALGVLRYGWDPEGEEALPRLDALEARVKDLARWSAPLKPLMDEALAKMRAQVWRRVDFQAEPVGLASRQR